MVMCGVRLRSQRQLLLIWQGPQIFQEMRTMSGPRRGLTETLGRMWRQRVGSPSVLDAGGFDRDETCIVGVQIKGRQIKRSLLAEARRRRGRG